MEFLFSLKIVECGADITTDSLITGDLQENKWWKNRNQFVQF